MFFAIDDRRSRGRALYAGLVYRHIGIPADAGAPAERLAGSRWVSNVSRNAPNILTLDRTHRLHHNYHNDLNTSFIDDQNMEIICESSDKNSLCWP